MEEEELQQAPQEQAQELPPEAEALSPYDTTAESAELEGIGKELSDIEKSIEGDFAQHISDLIDNDSSLEELFFSDRVTFFKKVLSEQNNFVNSLIEPRMARANELQGQIATKNELANIEAIKQQFQNQHPDIDIKELLRFFAEELPSKVQEEIKAQPMEQFFDIVYNYYMQSQQIAQAMQEQMQGQGQAPQEAEAQLPQQAQGVAVDSEQANTNAYLPMNRN